MNGWPIGAGRKPNEPEDKNKKPGTTTKPFGESAKPSTPGKHPETNNNNSNAGWTSCHPRPTTEKGSPAPKKK